MCIYIYIIYQLVLYLVHIHISPYHISTYIYQLHARTPTGRRQQPLRQTCGAAGGLHGLVERHAVGAGDVRRSAAQRCGDLSLSSFQRCPGSTDF